MASRPIYIPCISKCLGAKEQIINFKWHPGMAISQKQKSISELHEFAFKEGIERVLEISSKSKVLLGVQLSAFNLLITTKVKKEKFTVETAFQSSKVFEKGGPYKDLLGMNSILAKRDQRLKTSGNLIKFNFFGVEFPLEPKTFFYDWIYINALCQNNDIALDLINYNAFSDIEFNPRKSINCQARSAALYVSLKKNGKLQEALKSPSDFLRILSDYYDTQNNMLGCQRNLI
jgi:hypothetical protein